MYIFFNCNRASAGDIGGLIRARVAAPPRRMGEHAEMRIVRAGRCMIQRRGGEFDEGTREAEEWRSTRCTESLRYLRGGVSGYSRWEGERTAKGRGRMLVLGRLVFGACSRSCSCPAEQQMKEERTLVLVSNASRYENVEAGVHLQVIGLSSRTLSGEALMHSKGLNMVRMFNSTVYGLQKQITTTGDPPLSADIAIIKSTTELIQNMSL
ncbi:hypothetical protein B0H13DRAFT_1886784 [Mycena leptocephala]|nr:hypothetical protein B0H13DRAFT_1886784 [Mycena leptocephala]